MRGVSGEDGTGKTTLREGATRRNGRRDGRKGLLGGKDKGKKRKENLKRTNKGKDDNCLNLVLFFKLIIKLVLSI